MRKNLFRSVLTILLAVLMLCTVVGCGGSDVTSSDDFTGDDFFADDTESAIKGNDEVNSEPDSGSVSGSDKVETVKSEGKSWNEVLASMPKSLRGTTVTIYNWNPLKEYPGSSAVISKFEKATGIKVKWITQSYSTYLSNLASRVAAGQSPDLVRTNTPNPMGLISLQPIDVCGYDFSDKAWDQVLMKDYTYNGKIYATNLKNTHLGSANIVMYNKALINKYDLDDPYTLWKNGKWTWDKMLEISKAYMDESKASFAIGGGAYQTLASMYGVQGPAVYKDGKFANNTGDAKFLDVTKEIAKLRNTDGIYTGWCADEFNNGDCLFWMHGSIYARKNNAYFQSLKSAGQMNIVPFPSISGQKTYYQGMSEYEAYGIADGAPNAAAAPYLLRYFLDQENYDMSSVFCSAQAVEVYNWCMSQEHRIWSTIYGNQGFWGMSDDAFGDEHEKMTADQIVSFVNSNSALIDARVNQYNQAISKLN